MVADRSTYNVSIERPGLADTPELVRCADPAVAGEIVRVLLSCHDDRIRSVKVEIARITTKEVAV